MAPPGDSPAEPACARHRALADLFLPEDNDHDGSGPAPNDADVDWDVMQPSEANYDDPEELYNDRGVAFEPFHLKVEREEGYFDRESGSYVRLRKKEAVDDAWADALAATEVDARWAAAVLGRRRRAAGEDPEGDEASLGDTSNLKRRIAGLLLPGENTLAALRRLGMNRARAGSGSQQASISIVRGRVGLTPEARSDFDRLTEYSAALMEAGEYMAHSLTREELVGADGDRREEKRSSRAERLAEELLKSAAAAGDVSAVEEEPSVAAAVAPAPAEDDVDMFATDGDRDGDGEKKEAAPAAAGAPDASAGSTTPQLQGFVLDSATGYFYNSQMGAYYDPKSRFILQHDV